MVDGRSKPQRGETPQPRATPWVPRPPMTCASPARSSPKLLPSIKNQHSTILNRQSSILPLPSPPSTPHSSPSRRAIGCARMTWPSRSSTAFRWVGGSQMTNGAPIFSRLGRLAGERPANACQCSAVLRMRSAIVHRHRSHLRSSPLEPKVQSLFSVPCPPSTRPSNDSTT